MAGVSTDGSTEKISKYASFEKLHGVLGICFSNEMANSGFPYGIGAEYNGASVTDEGFDIVEIPAHTYAVFECKGKMPRKHSRRPIRRSAPSSSAEQSYKYGNGIELEIYPSADVTDPNYSARYGSPLKKSNNTTAPQREFSEGLRFAPGITKAVSKETA